MAQRFQVGVGQLPHPPLPVAVHPEEDLIEGGHAAAAGEVDQTPPDRPPDEEEASHRSPARMAGSPNSTWWSWATVGPADQGLSAEMD
ncbi:hypothetical protein GT755_30200 [Herbidospora sp. NEAU-GS84]|uniref:Uncharacterized protein n=1 Tax=Herbidospora solisilvae TaxID=2696284 RepID=A0A7C9P292_9ACTN|nr:hypothetical protein [Herbidospora solisilvae]NAS25937.1 hypothetical protein [Herbidospora solisilvae]